jgi:hypothetical protein
MKAMLHVLLHALCVMTGFWFASSSQVVEESSAGTKTSRIKTVEHARSASRITQPLSPPPAGSEAGVALLTPQNWAEAIAPMAELRHDALPAMLRGLMRNPFPEVKWRLLRYLFERWAVLDRNGALAAMRDLSSPQHKEYALRAILSIWTKTDTAAAWQYITAMEDDSVLQESGIEILLSLSTSLDPRAYAAWADQIDDVFLREKALKQIGDSWMSHDAKGAEAAAFTVEPERLRHYLLSKVCYRDGVDHQAGLEALVQLPSPGQRRELSAEWLSAFAHSEPLRALEWAKNHAENPELQKSGAELGAGLASQAKNIAELRSQLLQLPPGPLRDAAAAKASIAWLQSGHARQEARELLALCGPCIERYFAESEIND